MNWFFAYRTGGIVIVVSLADSSVWVPTRRVNPRRRRLLRSWPRPLTARLRPVQPKWTLYSSAPYDCLRWNHDLETSPACLDAALRTAPQTIVTVSRMASTRRLTTLAPFPMNRRHFLPSPPTPTRRRRPTMNPADLIGHSSNLPHPLLRPWWSWRFPVVFCATLRYRPLCLSHASSHVDRACLAYASVLDYWDTGDPDLTPLGKVLNVAKVSKVMELTKVMKLRKERM